MKKLSLFSTAAFLIITLTTLSYADVPKLINYQGHLTDKGGNPESGDFCITFTIYDAETDGSSLWFETQCGISVKNGLFSVLLGSVSEIPESVFLGADRWLGVAVQSDSEMEPRQQLVSVPYAYNTSQLSGQDASYYTDSVNFTGTDWTDLTDSGETDLHTHAGGGVTGSYDSGWFYATSGTKYTINHNLGTNKFTYSVFVSDNSGGSNAQSVPSLHTNHSPPDRHCGVELKNISSNAFDLQTGGFVIAHTYNDSGNYVDNITSGYLRIVVLALE